LATLNLGVYATLMERHLSGGTVAETDLVVRLERDLAALGDSEQSGLALIKSWASQGWLHRVADTRAGHERNVCYLTQDARRALDFVRGVRRNDTIATGGSINGIASRLKQVAVRVGNDPDRIRAGIEAEIAALHAELDELDAGLRPDPDVTAMYDEARAIAMQMERLITDIGLYGSMIEQATAALDDPIDSNADYRDRQRRMYADYQEAWDSAGRDSRRGDAARAGPGAAQGDGELLRVGRAPDRRGGTYPAALRSASQAVHRFRHSRAEPRGGAAAQRRHRCRPRAAEGVADGFTPGP
jgi:hypothetical protein